MFDPITAQRAVTLEGRYELRSVLGQGRFATLFEAHDRELDHQVALRVVRSDECSDARDFAPRFFADGARRVRLVSPHTAHVYDYGRTGDDTFFVAMELLRGRRLSFVLSGRGPLGDLMAAQVCERVCSSLVEAHRYGILHGHLSPERVWLTGRGFDGLKLLGHGTLQLHPRDPSDWPVHSVRYAAPEVLASGHLTPQADVYGAGLLLFELLTGRSAFAEDSATRIMLRHRQGGPCRGAWYEHICHMNPTLAAIVQRCLAPEPRERYESVAQLRAALMHHLVLQAA
jgi:serine/threonine protein kinase